MNKIFYFIIIIIFINSCSFDNKTGIWQGSDQITKKKLKKTESNLELVFQKERDCNWAKRAFFKSKA